LTRIRNINDNSVQVIGIGERG